MEPTKHTLNAQAESAYGIQAEMHKCLRQVI